MEVQNDIGNHEYKIAVVEETVLKEQATLGDLIRSVYTSRVYNIHLDNFEVCRTGQVPTAFVPPQLLLERLREVEKKLPNHLRFAIPIDNFQRYYRLSLGTCVWDASGGLLEVKLPLVEKSTNLQMLQFEPLHFGFQDTTCAIPTPAAFLIKDLKNNRHYTVTELDEEDCQPRTTGLCRVPYASAVDSNSFCLSALLSGEPATVLKESCKMQCFPDTRPRIWQASEFKVFGVHLEHHDVKMVCGSEVLTLETAVRFGAVRFLAKCNCQIVVDGKVKGKTTKKFCDDAVAPKMDVILPIQMSSFQDLMPFSDSGVDNTVFSNVGEILNYQFQPLQGNDDYDIPDVPFAASTVTWNLMQTAFMLYLYLRQNALAGVILTLMAALQNADASAPSKSCYIPNDVYALLWSIIAITLGLLLPKLLGFVYRFWVTCYTEQVQLTATKLLTEGTHEVTRV